MALQRWRLVEPEIDDGHTDPVDGASFDALDVPPDRFLTGPRAWQLARSGAADPIARRNVLPAGQVLAVSW
jgi:hypothetical protein